MNSNSIQGNVLCATASFQNLLRYHKILYAFYRAKQRVTGLDHLMKAENDVNEGDTYTLGYA